MEDWYNPGKKYISNRYVVLFYLNNIYFWTWALKKNCSYLFIRDSISNYQTSIINIRKIRKIIFDSFALVFNI